MADQVGKHYMHKTNIARLRVKIETSDDMPTRMPIMALAALAKSNRALDFQAGHSGVFSASANQVRITLVVIVLVWREARERVA